MQLADVNEYAVTNPQSQHVAVKGSVREKLPPGLTIKSSHIRIGESIGQGTCILNNGHTCSDKCEKIYSVETIEINSIMLIKIILYR